MKGNPAILDALNEALRYELTAINQHFLHGLMCDDWGYERLAEAYKKMSITEMIHAQKLMERILYLDGGPTMQYLNLQIGQNVKQQLTNDHERQLTVITLYNKVLALAVEVKDNGSRELFESLLVKKEENNDWMEAQLQQISDMGIANYLAAQVEED
jgi:bacterioferritin